MLVEHPLTSNCVASKGTTQNQFPVTAAVPSIISDPQPPNPFLILFFISVNKSYVKVFAILYAN